MLLRSPWVRDLGWARRLLTFEIKQAMGPTSTMSPTLLTWVTTPSTTSPLKGRKTIAWSKQLIISFKKPCFLPHIWLETSKIPVQQEFLHLQCCGCLLLQLRIHALQYRILLPHFGSIYYSRIQAEGQYLYSFCLIVSVRFSPKYIGWIKSSCSRSMW